MVQFLDTFKIHLIFYKILKNADGITNYVVDFISQ